MLTLVVGGARSGKSRFAQELALRWCSAPIYVATARIGDDEFAERVRRHRADRGPEWTTIEEPLAVDELDLSGRVVVVDCATLWLSNLFSRHGADLDRTLDDACRRLDRMVVRDARYIVVSNELGMAPHAMTEIGRRFVDLSGFFNQKLARRAELVVLTVAGLPTPLKGALSP